MINNNHSAVFTANTVHYQHSYTAEMERAIEEQYQYIEIQDYLTSLLFDCELDGAFPSPDSINFVL